MIWMRSIDGSQANRASASEMAAAPQAGSPGSESPGRGGLRGSWLMWRIWLIVERLPRPSELRDPRLYWRGAALARRMRREGYSMVGARRARALVRLATVVEREQVPGVIVDCGV